MAFWEKKMITYFNRIDLNRDGKISKEDFEDMAAKFIDAGFVSAANKATFTSNICGIWDSYLSKLGKDGGITSADFTAQAKELVKTDAGKNTLGGALDNFFKAVDTDGDEQISATEFELFYKIIGLDTSSAGSSFAAIDENNDGQLSLDEFKTAGIQFFTLEDESHPSKLFWGPLA